MTVTPRLALITIVATLAYVGLAVLGWAISERICGRIRSNSNGNGCSQKHPRGHGMALVGAQKTVPVHRKLDKTSSAMASRALLGGAAALLLITAAGAQYNSPIDFRRTDPTINDRDPGAQPDAAYALPYEFRRQPVFYRTHEAPGTIIVDTDARFLYLVQGGNRALRYGIGVGRDGFEWGGTLRIARKTEWPDWTPPPEMIQRQPYLPRWMAGGPGNPLGARALYLGSTIYRIHGTNAPETIGHAVSSGCFRLVNDEIVDLYERVPVGTKVVVMH